MIDADNASNNIEAITEKIEDIFCHAIDRRYRNFFVRFDLRFPDDGFLYDEAWCFGEFIRVFTQNRQREYGEVFYLWVRERVKSPSGPNDYASEVPPLTPSAAVNRTKHGSYDCANEVKHGHYHLFFLFDGKNTQNIFGHIKKAEELWSRYLSLNSGRPVDARGLVPCATGLERPVDARGLVPCATGLGHPVDARGLVHYGKEWVSHEGRDDYWGYSVPHPQQCRGVMITRDSSEEFYAHLHFCRSQSMYLAKTHTKDAVGPKGRTWGSTHGIPPRPSIPSGFQAHLLTLNP